MNRKLLLCNVGWAVCVIAFMVFVRLSRQPEMRWENVYGPHEILPQSRVDELRSQGLRLGFDEERIREIIKYQALKWRDQEVAKLNADLHSDWTSIRVGCRHRDSCCGTWSFGFLLERNVGGFQIATWSAGANPMDIEKIGVRESLTVQVEDSLIAEISLHFLGAVLSVDPSEKVGPFPTDGKKRSEWNAAYRAAGGTFRQRDLDWIEIHVETSKGRSSYVNLYEEQAPQEFRQWVSQFDENSKNLPSK